MCTFASPNLSDLSIFFKQLSAIKILQFMKKPLSKTIQLAVLLFFLINNILFSENTEIFQKSFTSQYGFIENKGQIIDQENKLNPKCLFLYNGNGLKIQLRKDGFSYEVTAPSQPSPKGREYQHLDLRIRENDLDQSSNNLNNMQENLLQGTSSLPFGESWRGVHRIDISFENMNTDVVIEKQNESSNYINYYTAVTPEQGITNVHRYEKIIYKNVYENIDVEFKVDANGKIEYDWIVKPGGKIEDIKLRYEGANKARLEDGKIVLETSYGNLAEDIPASYYLDNKNELLQVMYQQITSSDNQQIKQSSNFSIFQFQIFSYDHSRTLIIDPTPTVSWATYFGGTSDDYILDVITDSQNNVIISGYTKSSASIATSGTYQTSYGGSGDAFTAKFNSSGQLLWSTYYGGSLEDVGQSLVVDGNDNIICAGYTASTSGISTTGSNQSSFGGGTYDGYIVKFDKNGTIQWATYLGDSGSDQINDIAVDSQNNLFVVGTTSSASAIATTGIHQFTYSGSNDAFCVKFNSSGVFEWGAYLGGSSAEVGNAIEVDPTDNVIIGGTTSSSTMIATVGSFLSTYAGSGDGFVSMFDNAGNEVWSTYYGGSSNDEINAIDSDSNGDIVIAGYTNSSSGIATSGSYLSVPSYYNTTFIARFDQNANRQWGTYIASGASLTSVGDVRITFNTAGGILYLYEQDKYTYDIMIGEISSDGTSKTWAEMLYSSSYALGAIFTNSICEDKNHDIYIVGSSKALYAPTATSGAYQTTSGGGYDGFLTKLTGLLSSPQASFTASSDTICEGSCITFTDNSTSATSWNWTFQGATTTSSSSQNPTNICYATSGTYQVTLVASNSNGSDTSIQYITVNPLPQVQFAALDTVYTNTFPFALSGGTPTGGTYSGNGVSGGYFYPYLVSAGTYTITYSYSDSNSCSSSANQNIVVNTYVAGSNVWPGDANDDLIANNFDLLNVGLAYNATGTARISASNTWAAQVSTDWGKTFVNNVNYKHADCNGDGSINDDDTLAIYLNYGATHNKTVLVNNTSATNPKLYLVTTQDTVSATKTATIEIYLGTSNAPADSVYGFAFSINYDAINIDSGSVKLDYSNSWLGNKTNSLSLYKDFYDNGKVDVAFVRKDQQTISSFGKVGEMSCVLEDNLSGKDTIFKTMHFTISDVKVISNNESEIAVSTLNDSIVAVGPSSGTTTEIFEENLSEKTFQLFPNPATEMLQIRFSTAESYSVSIRNYLGQKLIEAHTQNESSIQINTQNLAAGTYFVEVFSNDYKMREVKKLLIQH